jgi:hypothetical protein
LSGHWSKRAPLSTSANAPLGRRSMAQRPNVRSIGWGSSSARCKRARDGRGDARGAILRSGRPTTGAAASVIHGRFLLPGFSFHRARCRGGNCGYSVCRARNAYDPYTSYGFQTRGLDLVGSSKSLCGDAHKIDMVPMIPMHRRHAALPPEEEEHRDRISSASSRTDVS